VHALNRFLLDTLVTKKLVLVLDATLNAITTDMDQESGMVRYHVAP